LFFSPHLVCAPVTFNDAKDDFVATEPFLHAVTPLLSELEASANAHDTDRHMAAYAKDPSLTFVFNGELIRGWDALREQQRRWWDDGKATLTYKYLDGGIIESLADDLGMTTLLIGARRTTPEGEVIERTLAYSALWRRRKEGWRIIFAHESSTK
jgi:ketosteroid isomerase-like protein